MRADSRPERLDIRASARRRKGISSPTVSSRPALTARLLLAALLLLLPACSRKAERLVGNERLARGPGGLGATTRVIVAPDRDTWLDTGTRVTGSVLLVANTGTFEAVTHLKVATWNLPSPALDALSVISVELFAIHSYALRSPNPITIQLAMSTTAWVPDTTLKWPGPAPGEVLAEATRLPTDGDLFTDSLTIASPLDILRRWAGNPDSIPGFQLRASSPVPGTIAAFHADSLFFRVAYRYKDKDGNPQTATIDSRVTTDVYVHSPATTLATGGEQTLRLGGYEYPSVAMRFPIPELPSGAAINEGTLLLHVNEATTMTPGVAGDSTVDLQVRTLGNEWAESAADTSGIHAAATPATALTLYAYRSLADSLIAIRLPVGLIRSWRATATSDHGLLITALRGDAAPVILIDSRESAHPPRLRLSYTTRPGGRF